MRLILIRHGQTPSNVVGALDTAHPGAGLTELGRAQAAAVPGALAGQPVTAIHASSLVRTQLTAEPLAGDRDLSVAVHDGLVEISAGEVEMRSDEEAIATYHGCLGRWFDGDLHATIPGGESGTAFLARYDAAVRAIADALPDPDATAVAFSHGAAIRVWTALRTLPADAAGRGAIADRRLDNTAALTVSGHPDTGWTLLSRTPGPLGGPGLSDTSAPDPTGDEPLDAERR